MALKRKKNQKKTTDKQSNRVTCKTEATVAVDGVSCFQAQC